MALDFPPAPMKIPINRENLLRIVVKHVVCDDQVCVKLIDIVRFQQSNCYVLAAGDATCGEGFFSRPYQVPLPYDIR